MTIWTDEMKSAAMRDAAQVVKLTERNAKLEAALRNLVADVDDYERVNNLSPSPGRLHSWQSMRIAKEVIGAH